MKTSKKVGEVGAKRDIAKLQVCNGVRWKKKVSWPPKGTGPLRRPLGKGHRMKSGDPVEPEADKRPSEHEHKFCMTGGPLSTTAKPQ